MKSCMLVKKQYINPNLFLTSNEFSIHTVILLSPMKKMSKKYTAQAPFTSEKLFLNVIIKYDFYTPMQITYTVRLCCNFTVTYCKKVQ